MKRTFEINFPNDLGPMWLNMDNLRRVMFSKDCIGKVLEKKITVKDTTDEKDGGGCSFAGTGRGDCENEVGLPGEEIHGQHDGPDDTVDCYGKPNGWCWSCWRSHQIKELEDLVTTHEEVHADGRRLVREIDVILSGKEGAAPQASLCDLVGQIRRLKERNP